MAAGGCGEALLPGKYYLGRQSCFQGDNGWKQFGHKSLLCTETTPDPGFDDSNFLFWNIQSPGGNGTDMEWHLGGCNKNQAAGMIHIREGPEGFHHGLVVGTGFIGLIHNDIGCFKGSINISVGEFP